MLYNHIEREDRMVSVQEAVQKKNKKTLTHFYTMYVLVSIWISYVNANMWSENDQSRQETHLELFLLAS